MAPPDRVFRSVPQMPHSQPTPSPEPFGILTTLGHLGLAPRTAQPHRGILGFMLPPDMEREGNPRGPTRADSRPADPSRGPASMDEVSPAEIMNLAPYERWLVTLPDDSPELFGQPDPRVGPAPTNPPRHLINESTIDPGSVVLTAGDTDNLVGGAGDDALVKGTKPQRPWRTLGRYAGYVGMAPGSVPMEREIDQNRGGPWGGAPLEDWMREFYLMSLPNYEPPWHMRNIVDPLYEFVQPRKKPKPGVPTGGPRG